MLLNFIILTKKNKKNAVISLLNFLPRQLPWNFSTYNFLVVDFQATDDQVHRLLRFAVFRCMRHIICMWLVSSALQIESRVIDVYNFEHGHVFGQALVCVELRLEAVSAAVWVQHKVISTAHNHGFVARFQRLFRQVA